MTPVHAFLKHTDAPFCIEMSVNTNLDTKYNSR